MTKSRAARIGLATLLAFSVSLVLAGAADGQATTEPTAVRAAGSSCDEGGWDRPPDGEIGPGNADFNPEFKGTKTQLWQKHYLREDTYAIATAGNAGVRIYIEDSKNGQRCFSQEAAFAGQEIKTGVLDNRNTSVRVVIVDRNLDKGYGRYYREDAGGHSQTDDGRGIIDGDPDIDKGAKASYDDHEAPSAIRDILPAKYNAQYGHITRGWLEQNYWDESGAHETFGVVSTRNKDMMVSLQSDKYGQGDWHKVHKQDHGQQDHGPVVYEGTTGILYNRSDALRVCVKQDSEENPYCGRWHKGPGGE